VEEGLFPFYTTWCGGVRSLGFTLNLATVIPIWRLSLYDDFFILTAGNKYAVKYTDVIVVTLKRKFIFKVLRIQARQPLLEVTFFLISPRKVARLFRGKGVEVTGLEESGMHQRDND
jgi:hypothetical protein